MKHTNIILLILGGLLIAIGIVKPDVSKLIKINPNTVVEVNLQAPSDPLLRTKADVISNSLKDADVVDMHRLRDLAIDMSILVGLDGENLIIKTTEEIRQAVSMSGIMLHLDIKGKYPSLAQDSNALMIAAIGDDDVPLTPELRQRSVNALQSLAWAYNGGK